MTDNKTLNNYIGASVGYLSVAVLSAFTGYTLMLYIGVNASPNGLNLGLVLAFSLLLLPYLINRESLLEKEEIPDIYDHHVRSEAYQFPIIFFIGFVVLFMVGAYILWLQKIAPFSFLIKVTIVYIVALLPFLSLFIRSNYLLKEGENDLAYSFLESILLPALSVCIIPFSVGCSIGIDDIDLLVVIFATLFIIILLIMSIFFFKGISNRRNFFIIFIYIVVFCSMIAFYDYYTDSIYSKLLRTSAASH